MGVLDWMADALRDAGLSVVEYPGWRDRAAPGAFTPCAVMWHHDASTVGPSPAMDTLIAVRGNTTTPAPLAHCWVDTRGVWTLCASGRANHAGKGDGWGRIGANAGNRDAIGVETDHTTGEPWPAEQVDALRRGTRVLLDHLAAQPSNALCGHKEYTRRKTDPDGLDMAWERANLPAAVVVAVSREDEPMRFVYGNGPRPWSDFLFKVTFPPGSPIAVRVHVPNERDPGFAAAIATGAGMDPATGEPYVMPQSALDGIPFATEADRDRFHVAAKEHVDRYHAAQQR